MSEELPLSEVSFTELKGNRKGVTLGEEDLFLEVEKHGKTWKFRLVDMFADEVLTSWKGVADLEDLLYAKRTSIIRSKIKQRWSNYKEILEKILLEVENHLEAWEEKQKEEESVKFSETVEAKIQAELNKILEAENQLEALEPHLDNVIVGETENKKAVFVLIVLLGFLSVGLAYGSDDYGGHLYLFRFVRNIGPSGFYGSDPKAMGMGNVRSSGLEDASAICWNPAGAALLEGANATLVYGYSSKNGIRVRNNYEEIADSDYRYNHHHMVDGFMTFSTPLFTVGLSYSPIFAIPIDVKLLMAPKATHLGHLNCDAFTLTLARRLRKNIAIGINLSYIHTDGRLEIDYEPQKQTDALGNVIGEFLPRHLNSLSGNGFGSCSLIGILCSGFIPISIKIFSRILLFS